MKGDEPRFYPWPGGRHMIGRFSVPGWLFYLAPGWLHEAADWCGGVTPSPWKAHLATDRVKALHSPVACECVKCTTRRDSDEGISDLLCEHCTSLSQKHLDGGIRWPCPTRTALDEAAVTA